MLFNNGFINWIHTIYFYIVDIFDTLVINTINYINNIYIRNQYYLLRDYYGINHYIINKFILLYIIIIVIIIFINLIKNLYLIIKNNFIR